MKRAFTIIAAAIAFTSCTSNAQKDPYDVILAKEQAYVDSLDSIDHSGTSSFKPSPKDADKITATWKAYDKAFKATEDTSANKPSVKQMESHLAFLKRTGYFIQQTDYLKK